MRLPVITELSTPEHRFLYEYDIKEWHSPSFLDIHASGYRNRITLVLQLIRRFKRPPASILEVGCAQANMSLLLAEMGYETTALDINPHFLEYARRKHEYGQCHFVASNFFELEDDFGPFDVVICGEVIEHVAYPEALLAKTACYLKPAGILVLTTPNGSWRGNTLPTYSSVKRRDRKTFEINQFAPDQHLFLYTDTELGELLGEAGFQSLAVRKINTYWRAAVLKRARAVEKIMPKAMARGLARAVTAVDRAICRVPILERNTAYHLVVVARYCG